ncbi:MAG: hypothetical protein CBB97_06225 [Candidatus Endolissoclinum sp. TMED37]|nr:MAG: hypothetical protein CBB97_06225 [Candidatus Endolissoclinum sp. TMED37]
MPAPDYSSLNNVVYTSDADRIIEVSGGQETGYVPWLRTRKITLGYRPIGAAQNINSNNPSLKLTETLDTRNFQDGKQNFGHFVAPTYIAFDRYAKNESGYSPESWAGTPVATGGDYENRLGELFGYVVFVQDLSATQRTTQDEVSKSNGTPWPEPAWTGKGTESEGIPYYKFYAFVDPDGTVLEEDAKIPELNGNFRIAAETGKETNSYATGGPWTGVENLGGLTYQNDYSNSRGITSKLFKNTWIRFSGFNQVNVWGWSNGSMVQLTNKQNLISFNFLKVPYGDTQAGGGTVTTPNPQWDGVPVNGSPQWGGSYNLVSDVTNPNIEISQAEPWWWRIFFNTTGFKGVYPILNKLDVDDTDPAQQKFKLMQKTSPTSDYQEIPWYDLNTLNTLTLDDVKDKIMSLNSGFGSKGIRITPAAWNLLCTTIYDGYKGNTN